MDYRVRRHSRWRYTTCMDTGAPRSHAPYREERPWGYFEQFTHNEPTTVKLLTVLPGARLSLQYHEKREECWRVVAGNGTVELNGEVLPCTVGDAFTILPLAEHRLIGGTETLVVLEVAYGEFDEDDIVRVADVYGRT